METEPAQDTKKKPFTVISVLAIAAGVVVGNILGIAFLFLLPSLILGVVIANYQMSREKKDGARWVRIINWSNLGTWIFPFLGVFTSVFSLTIAEKASQKRKFIVLGLVGLALSIINAILGMQYYTGTGLFGA